ncbi:MAG: restriction endonuclease [Myxococcales bacterium]|nr:restriction endonuclease [Myxococcales bacterium]
MTFYEAALRVLEGAGRPLHVFEITEKSIQQNLLSHVGKTPEQTMLSRLAAMARRRGDRKVIVTAKDTFALADWQLPEDAQALEQTGVAEPHPEEALPPLRPPERHPEPRGDNVRAVGRGERKRRRDEEEERGRRRRFPPLPEVVFEVLSDAGEGLPASEIAERARARELAGEDLTPEQILTALLEDNQRRIDASRRPQFLFDRESGRVSLERAGQPSEAPPLELQAAFAAALGIPLEGGRPVLPRSAERGVDISAELGQVQAAKAAAKDARKAMARVLRRTLAELDAGTLEKAAARMLHALHFRELKVAKRSKEGPLLTARRREGSLEVRCAVRFIRGSGPVDRRAVQELRRDLGHYSAQLGLLLCPGDLRGDGRGEAQSGGPLVFLWCGEALAEKFLEAKVGVLAHKVELYELDEAFFEQARLDAEEARRRREERLRERHEEEEPAEPARAGEVAPGEPPGGTPESAEELEGEEEGEEGEEEGEELVASAPGEAGVAGPELGEHRRRRRRRRGRRGRGPRAPELARAPGAPEAAAPPPSAEAPEAAPLAPPPQTDAAPLAPPPQTDAAPPPAPENTGGGTAD